MVRKIIVFICAASLVLAFGLVCGAVDPDVQPVYSPIQFDSFYTSESDVAYPWPYNSIDYVAQQVEYTFDHNGFVGDYSVLSDNSVFGTFTCPELQGNYPGFSIFLSADKAQFVDHTLLNSFGISAGSGVPWMQVNISFNVWEPVVNSAGTGYVLVPSAKSVQATSSTGDVKVGVFIASQLAGSYDYYLISDLVVEILIPTYVSNIQQLAVVYNFTRDNDYASLFFNERDLVYQSFDSSEVGLFDWLLNSVQGFLDLEIVPGISINGLFVVFVVIAVLLWFLTLLI